MTPGRYDQGYRQLVHHLSQGTDGGAAVTLLPLIMDGLLISNDNTSVQPTFPSAARLRSIGVHATCAAVNVAGDWTLHFRVNNGGADAATFNVPFPAIPGAKTVGQPSAEVLVQAGQNYYCFLDGPSRNFTIARVLLEWEIL